MTALDAILQNVSRRRFLGGALSTGAFVVASQVLPEPIWAQDATIKTHAQSAPLHPSIYLGIEPDGTVFIVTHRSEMGTGIRTSLPLVAADELDADWSRVRVEQGLGDAAYGSQNTDGSCSIRDFYDAFRRAGAGCTLDARQRRGRAVESAGLGDQHREPHRCASRVEPPPALRRPGAGRREVTGAEAGRFALQIQGRLEVRREGTADLRPPRHQHR
jgi:hypothetical protein